MNLNVCLILNDAFSMFRFRAGLVRELVRRGHSVTTIVPEAGEYRAKLQSLGADVIEIPMARFVSPASDLVTIWKVAKLFRRKRFDIVHTMTIKPNLYFPIIAKACGVRKVFGLVSGVGYLLGEHGRRQRPVLSSITIKALKVSFQFHDRVWFQNRENAELFETLGICDENKAVVIRGSGVDTTQFSPGHDSASNRVRKRRELGIPESAGIVLMVAARMIASKGVREFASAAKLLSAEFTTWRFVLVAPDDPGTPDHVDVASLKAMGDELVICNEFRTDLPELIAASDVVTLPSYYPEGVPRFLLEGLASGKPIVTTDTVGCRETVLDGTNGYLVAAQDEMSLATALGRLMANQRLRVQFGEASRALALKEYSEGLVASRVCNEVYGLGSRT